MSGIAASNLLARNPLMLDATFCGDPGAVAAKLCNRGPGNFPNNDPPSADDDVSVLPGGTAVPSLESAVVPKFSSTSLLRGPYQNKLGYSSLESEIAHAIFPCVCVSYITSSEGGLGGRMQLTLIFHSPFVFFQIYSPQLFLCCSVIVH